MKDPLLYLLLIMHSKRPSISALSLAGVLPPSWADSWKKWNRPLGVLWSGKRASATAVWLVFPTCASRSEPWPWCTWKKHGLSFFTLSPWRRSLICHMRKKKIAVALQRLHWCGKNEFQSPFWLGDQKTNKLSCFFPVISSYICMQSVNPEISHYAVPDFAKTGVF